MSQTYIPQALRNQISEQAQYRCGYCLTPEWIVGSPMEIDHIIPESLGGLTEEGNLWLACTLCNKYKAGRISATDPASGDVVRLFDPYHQAWLEHFVWVEQGILIVGRTAVGRATVAALNLNRASLVLARRLWVQAGWYPPEN